MSYPAYPAYKDSNIDWLGQIPTHWQVTRFKHMCSQSALYGANESSASYADDGIRFLRTTDITDQGDLISSDAAVYLDEALVSDYLLNDGDILLSRSGTVGRSFVYDSLLHGKCAYAGYLVRFVPKDDSNPRFIYYFTKSKEFEEWLSSSTISSTIGNVNGQKYANMPLPMPSLEEQTRIAAFLDAETAQIDTLIAKQERLIALLQEKRQALISHAVTRGLNPDAPMKESGVEWLGEVPAHWEISGFTKYLDIVDYRGRTPQKVDDGMFLVTARNIKGGKIDYSLSEEYVDAEDAESLLNRGRPEVGDVLMTTEAPLGEVANVDRVDFALAQRIIKLRGVPEKLNNYFLKYWIMSSFFQQHLGTLATGSTALGIKGAKLHMLKTILPPLTEQEKIVAYIEEKTALFDSIIARSVNITGLLQERRTALISAAVTGKIDVRAVMN